VGWRMIQPHTIEILESRESWQENLMPIEKQKRKLLDKQNRKQLNEQHLRWKHENLERCRASQRKADRKRRGVSNPTGETRSGLCEICGRFYEKLNFDHNHSSGKHRG